MNINPFGCKIVNEKSNIILSNSIQKSGIDCNFRTINSLTSLWTISLNAGYTLSESPLTFSGSAGVGKSAQIDSDFTYGGSSFYHLIYGFSYNPTAIPSGNSYPMSFMSRNASGTTYYLLELKSSEAGGVSNTLEITVESSAGIYTTSHVLNSRDVRVRVSLVPGSYILGYDSYLFFSVYDGGEWHDVTFADPYIPFIHADDQAFRLLLNEQTSVESVTKLKPILFYPVITAPLCANPMGFPIPINSTATNVKYEADPLYEGDFSGTVYGVGINWTSTATMAVSVSDKILTESNLTFMTSQLKALYTDLVEGLACPDSDMNVDAIGNVRIDNECFCDGSLRDISPMYLNTSRTGSIARDTDKRRYAEFLLANDDYEYGKDLDFKRVFNGSQLEASSYPFKFMRTLQLSDGSLFYYGANCNEYSADQEIFIKWETENTNEDGDPITKLERWIEREQDNTQIDYQSFDSGTPYNILSDSDLRYRLSPGRYKFKFNKAMDYGYANQSLSVAVYLGTSTGGNKLVEWPPERPVEETQINELRFEIKQHRADLTFAYHNACDSTLSVASMEDNDVDVWTNSLTAFQIDDDSVVVLYSPYQESNKADNRFNHLYYRVVTLSTMAISTVGLVNLPLVDGNAEQYVFCFDGYKDNDGILRLVCGIGQERGVDGPPVRYTRTTIPTHDYLGRERRLDVNWEPFVAQGVFCFTFDTSKSVWDGSDVNIDKNFKNVSLKSLQQINIALKSFPYPVDDNDGRRYGEGFFGYPIASPYNIRIDYRRDIDKAVMCVIDDNMRLGVVMVGNKHNWQEAYVPTLFNHEYQSTLTPETWAKLESLSAGYGQDGFIYGVGSTKSLDYQGLVTDKMISASAFVASDEFISSGGDSYVTFFRGARAFDYLDDLSFFQPKFNTFVVPILGNNGSIDTVTYEKYNTSTLVYDSLGSFDAQNQKQPCYYELGQDKNSLVLTMHGGFESFANVFRNGDLDITSMSTHLEEVYIDSTHAINGDTWSTTNVLSQGYRSRLNNNGSDAIIERSFGLGDVNNARNSLGHIGYRFSARVQAVPSVGVFDGTYVDMTATVACGEYSESLSLSPPTYAQIQARYHLIGDEIELEYWDEVSGIWEFVDSYVIDFGTIYDLHILLKNDGIDENGDAIPYGSVSFIIKKYASADLELVDTFNYSEERCESVYYRNVSNINLKTVGVTEECSFTIEMPASGTFDVSENCYVYYAGWGLLQSDGRTNTSVSATKGGTPFFEVSQLPKNGSNWVQFNDTRLLVSQEPRSKFRSFVVDGGKTPSFYFHNGFRFSLYGNKTFTGDTVKLQRQYLNRIDGALSLDIHGSWGTQTDSADVHLWGDAADSGLSVFEFDTVVLNGVNFRYSTLVGKNDIADPWTEIASLDMKILETPFFTFEAVDSTRGLITLTDANLGIDKWGDYEVYVWSDEFTAPLRVTSIHKDTLAVQARDFISFLSSSKITIFLSRKSFDVGAQNYKFVGLRIDSQLTYEEMYSIKDFDIGKATIIPTPFQTLDARITANDYAGNILTVIDESAISKNYKIPKRSYSMSYDVISGIGATKIVSMLDSISSLAQGVWVLENREVRPHQLRYCLLDGPPTKRTIFDEEGQRIYQIEFDLRSVE